MKFEGMEITKPGTIVFCGMRLRLNGWALDRKEPEKLGKRETLAVIGWARDELGKIEEDIRSGFLDEYLEPEGGS